MEQNDDSKEKEIEGNENWLNEHGQPNSEYLQSLAADGSPEALEKLKSIADDLDVVYDPNTSAEELVGKIESAAEEEDETESPNTAT